MSAFECSALLLESIVGLYNVSKFEEVIDTLAEALLGKSPLCWFPVVNLG